MEQNDSAPTNYDEYLARFMRNNKVEGYGMKVRVIAPCPFCAAPNFMSYLILETEKAIQSTHTCNECGRSMRGEVTKNGPQTTLKMMQCAGPEQPAWLGLARLSLAPEYTKPN